MSVSLLLPHRLEQDNANGGGEIQTARATHGNGEELISMRRQQTLRQALGLPAKDKKIVAAKTHVVIGAVRFRCQEKEASIRVIVPKLLERIPELHVDFLPVIEP